MKKRIVVFILVFAVFAIVGFYKIFTETDFTPPNHSIPKKYISLFSDSCIRGMTFILSETNKSNEWRDTVSSFSLYNRYRVLVSKLKDTTSLDLNNYIKQENISSYWSSSLKVVNSYSFGVFNLEYLPKEEPQDKDGIIFRYCCDAPKCFINQKDRIYFSDSFGSISICKGKNGNADFIFNVLPLNSPQLSVMFLRKNKNIYFITMAPIYNGTKMDSKLLWDCVK
ncbi:MAG TPA: hypothetical protein VK806_09225 [Bacteroidia bacterium]|jgi:hypothetical protein|nr:hypothetical protein [Bacteroidia bacterium]